MRKMRRDKFVLQRGLKGRESEFPTTEEGRVEWKRREVLRLSRRTSMNNTSASNFLHATGGDVWFAGLREKGFIVLLNHLGIGEFFLPRQ